MDQHNYFKEMYPLCLTNCSCLEEPRCHGNGTKQTYIGTMWFNSRYDHVTVRPWISWDCIFSRPKLLWEHKPPSPDKKLSHQYMTTWPSRIRVLKIYLLCSRGPLLSWIVNKVDIDMDYVIRFIVYGMFILGHRATYGCGMVTWLLNIFRASTSPPPQPAPNHISSMDLT